MDRLKLHDPLLFGPLNESTVRGWFQQGSYKDLTPNMLKALKRGTPFYKPQASGMKHCLKNYPNIVQEITEMLKSLRISGTSHTSFFCFILSILSTNIIILQTGAALSVASVQTIMRAVLKERHPEILHENGGKLKLSYHFCAAFVKTNLNWTLRKATTAAQKVPANWKQQVLDMTKRLAITVHEGNIPRQLLFSMDETFCFFVPMGHCTTLTERGAKV